MLESLPEVQRKVLSVATTLKNIHKRDFTHADLTEIRDDLNECAEAVQSIRDQIVFPQ